jgi:hypothetical protein
LLVAPTPAQAEKIVKFKAAFRNEIIPTTIKTGEKLSITQLTKKNCLMLVLQGLKLTKTVKETMHDVGAHFCRKGGNTEIRVQIPYFTMLD